MKCIGDKYDYSKVKYFNNQTKVCIICPKHGEFWQSPKSHLNGKGCYECSIEIRKIKCKENYKPNFAKRNRKTNEEFIADAKKIHGEKYDYSIVEYINNKTKIIINCPIHR